MSLWLLFLLVSGSVYPQAVSPPPAQAGSCLLPGEKQRLATEKRLDSRIRIYDDACLRCETMISDAVRRGETQMVSDILKSWTMLLEDSVKDVEATPGRKDKSKALRRYEIRLRKSISSVQESKMKATVDQLEEFDAWIVGSDKIRGKLVEFLFPK